MLKRLMTGIVIGLVVGALAAAALIKGFGVVLFMGTGLGTMTAYLAALATGAFVALVAGKPVWAKGAWIEVGLKAFFGSLLAAGGMFALRKWGGMNVNLSSFGAGEGAIGFLPAAALPIIAMVLSMFFEIDNTDPPEEQASPKSMAAKPAAKALPGASKVRVAASAKEELEAEEEAVASKKKQRN